MLDARVGGHVTRRRARARSSNAIRKTQYLITVGSLKPFKGFSEAISFAFLNNPIT
jgi:hypothetical protein